MPASLLRTNLPVLCYHQVCPGSGLPPKEFEAHLQTIRDAGFTSVGLDRLFAFLTGTSDIHQPSLVLTFDDATLDSWVHTIPLLRRFGMTGVFFAVSDFIGSGTPRPTMENASTPPVCLSAPEAFRRALSGDRAQFMNEAEIHAAVNDLGMEVYSHTRTHQACFTSKTPLGNLKERPHWSHAALLPAEATEDTPVYPRGSAYARDGFWFDSRGVRHEHDAKARFRFCLEELGASRERLARVTGRDCAYLCWPWGEYDQLCIEAAVECGYKGTLTLDRGPNARGGDPLRIRRIGVASRKDRGWLVRKLAWHRTWLGAMLCR